MKTNIKSKILLCALLTTVLLFLFFTVFVEGAEKEGSLALPEEYSAVVDSLPSDIESALPDGVFSGDAEQLGEAVEQMSRAEYIISYIGELLSLGMPDAVGLLVAIVGILMVAALLSALRSAFMSETMGRTIGFCTSAALFGFLMRTQLIHLERAAEFFERINTLMLGMIPATAVIYAMGGNITTALSSGSTLYLFLAFSENFCARTIVPVVSICTAFSLCASLSPSVNMRGFSAALKRCYVFILGLIMTVLLASLASQTALSTAADTVSARAAKLVASSVIPIVGGSVGETLRTLASSVGYIKNACGIGAILFIVLLVLPIIVTLLLTRTVFIISVAVADLLGCERESRVLGEIGSVYGTLLAVVCMVSVMFILALTLFVRCAVAAG